MLGNINKYFRKEKLKEETLDYNQVQELLSSLNEETNISGEIENINYFPYDENKKKEFRGQIPAYALGIIKNFKPESKEDYFDASYKIFSKGKKKENHYMEIEAGKEETSTKNIGKKKKATLEWIVNKET